MTTGLPTIDDVDFTGKTVLVRVDLNVPVDKGQIRDDSRIKSCTPTLKELAAKGARVIVMSHFGRPNGKIDMAQSLAFLEAPLSKSVGRRVTFIPASVGPEVRSQVAKLKAGDIALLENLRFHIGEENNDAAFAAELASLADIYVNDAFSVSHRAHASVEAVAKLLPSYAGRSLEAEVRALNMVLTSPMRPVVAIVAGAKISTKLHVLEHLIEKVDTLVIGGAMAHTFLLAQGVKVGKSLAEPDLVPVAGRILAAAHVAGCQIVLPVDVQTAQSLTAGAPTTLHPVRAIPADEMALDIGPETVATIGAVLKASKTVVWNGPLGAFETPPFDAGTKAIAQLVAQLTQDVGLVSVAGGGDTLAAINAAGVLERFTYVSTAGGAFLEWLEGRTLPGVAVLQSR